MDFKTSMGVLSVIIMVLAYTVYLWQASRPGEGVQPHPFSWLLWGLVTGVAYLVQAATGGGAGSWVSGLTAATCILIGGISLRRHQWTFSAFDWIALGAGLVALMFYLLAKNMVLAAVLATLADAIGYGSTIKRGWVRPYNDSVSSFALNSAKFVPAICALKSYSVTTWIYPSTLVFMNGAVAAMLVLRRQQLFRTGVSRVSGG
jgi:hypothetical protein